MSETLYRKYRPKDFSEMVGQNHIVRTLSNAISNNRVGHAYLFAGPRGTGKTSVARIFAKAVNCEKLKGAQTCQKCPSCVTIASGKSLDIIEIDAASNTGVDNIRELRETVGLAAASLKYKVYIIDEVHMLSTGAFNALLKTLEEPPAHVIFILATTEIHKVPQTIISRCQRFDFTRLPISEIIAKLTRVAKSENVSIEREALELIAISAEGGMRDAESLLGQILALEDKNITVQEAEDLLGTAGKGVAQEIARLIMEKNSTAAVAKVNAILEDGYDLQVFNKSLVNYLRQLMLVKIDPELKKHFSFELPENQFKELIDLAKKSQLADILRTINLFLEAHGRISAFVLPQLPLEIAIIKATHTFPAPKQEIQEIAVEKRPDVTAPEKKVPSMSELSTKIEEAAELSSAMEVLDEAAASNSPLSLERVQSSWKKILLGIRPFNHSLSALLCNCQPASTKGNLLTLATPYEFYRERLNEAKNKLTVEEVFSKILGSNIKVEVVIDKSLAPKESPDEPEEIKSSEQDSLLSDAIDIMGGKIVEE